MTGLYLRKDCPIVNNASINVKYDPFFNHKQRILRVLTDTQNKSHCNVSFLYTLNLLLFPSVIRYSLQQATKENILFSFFNSCFNFNDL